MKTKRIPIPAFLLTIQKSTDTSSIDNLLILQKKNYENDIDFDFHVISYGLSAETISRKD